MVSRFAIFLALCGLIVSATAATAAADLDVCNQANGEESIAACSRLLASRRLTPKNRSIIFNIRGNLWSDKGDKERAIADYTDSIRINPKDAHPHSNRAHRYREQGKPDLAFADYESALRLDPKLVSALVGKGYILEQRGLIDGAIAAFELAIRLDPKTPIPYVARGDLYFGKGDYSRALADYDEALRIDPMATSAYTKRGLTYEKLGDVVRARSAFNAALAVPPKYTNGRWAQDQARARIAALDARNDQKPAPAMTASHSAPSATVAASSPGRRIALVIGNSAYRSVTPLSNPRRDAEALSETLRSIGFEIVRLENDLSRENLVDALRAFGKHAEQADWAVVYYAGHGIEVGGINYLLPVDAVLDSDRDVQFAGVPLEQVLASVEGARKLRLIILDACRDNPFVRQMKRSAGTRSVGRGLARIEPEGGTLVAYAAKHGEVAFDGEGANSPFVSSLVKRLTAPGVEVSKLFRLVRDDVMAATNRKQEPFVYGSLPGEDFFFVASK